MPTFFPPAALAVTDRVATCHVLVVDDEVEVGTLIARHLARRGYAAHTATSGADALQKLREQRFTLMLCDVSMPGLSGLEVTREARRIDPDLAILILSGNGDAETATEAFLGGAVNYLLKPIDIEELNAAMRSAMHSRDLLIEQRRVERLIREEVAHRTHELEREQQALRDLTVSIAESLITAMETKDVYLRGHSHRVAALAASIAEELGLDADRVEHVRLAGRLHDVGKIGIREAVLNKPGALTPAEFAHVKEHVQIGMSILAPLQHLRDTLIFVQEHHEHWDGSGYPAGLAGAAISIGGRILAAADAFDALTSARAYRKPMSHGETLDLLAAERGRLLDPEVYDALARVIRRRDALTFLEVAECASYAA